MLEQDAFSRWLGIELLEISEGSCRLRCTVKEEMVNGFNIAHGGISYSIADSTLAFASNAYGYQCMSIETSISHFKKIQVGDILSTQAKEIKRGKNIGVYEVQVFNQNKALVAHFKGTVFVSSEKW